MLDISKKKKGSSTKSVSKGRSQSNVGLSTARLKKMIKKLMDNLENDDVSGKASVSELLKLLQVYKELTADQVKEVEVRWVDRLRADDESGT
jgi:hypothetical protein